MLRRYKDGYYYDMGKGRRKSTANKPQKISSRATKSSEIAPKFQTTSDNEFQNALARKDFDKAKQILDKAKNLEEWRKLNRNNDPNTYNTRDSYRRQIEQLSQNFGN